MLLNPNRLSSRGKITLKKKIRNSLLHSPRIEKEDAKISENRLVLQPIKMTKFIVALVPPVSKDKRGMSSLSEE